MISKRGTGFQSPPGNTRAVQKYEMGPSTSTRSQEQDWPRRVLGIWMALSGYREALIASGTRPVFRMASERNAWN